MQFIVRLPDLIIGNLTEQSASFCFLQVDISFIGDGDVGMHEITRQGMVLGHGPAVLQTIDRIPMPVLVRRLMWKIGGLIQNIQAAVRHINRSQSVGGFTKHFLLPEAGRAGF